MKIPKIKFQIAVLRGRTTKYFYGQSLKDCLSHLKPGESFAFVKYEHGPERVGVFHGKSWSEVA
jgi:hypothetical protein